MKEIFPVEVGDTRMQQQGRPAIDQRYSDSRSRCQDKPIKEILSISFVTHLAQSETFQSRCHVGIDSGGFRFLRVYHIRS